MKEQPLPNDYPLFINKDSNLSDQILGINRRHFHPFPSFIIPRIDFISILIRFHKKLQYHDIAPLHLKFQNIIHTYQLWKMQILLHMLCISIRSSLPLGTGTNNDSSMIRNHGHIGKLAVIRQNFKRITWFQLTRHLRST